MRDPYRSSLGPARALVHDGEAEADPKPLARAELLALLRGLAHWPLPAQAHLLADAALLRYLDDPEIRRAYAALEKRYR